ncbi:hypothetical protein D3C71_1185820 [compost metagenome]
MVPALPHPPAPPRYVRCPTDVSCHRTAPSARSGSFAVRYRTAWHRTDLLRAPSPSLRDAHFNTERIDDHLSRLSGHPPGNHQDGPLAPRASAARSSRGGATHRPTRSGGRGALPILWHGPGCAPTPRTTQQSAGRPHGAAARRGGSRGLRIPARRGPGAGRHHVSTGGGIERLLQRQAGRAHRSGPADRNTRAVP